MKPGREEWYIGIEASRRWLQVSCYHAGLTEPETKSTLAGTELYQIPTALCKRKQTGQWCFGEEGRRLAETGEGYYAADLLKRAFRKETVSLDRDYAAQDLLLVLLRKVLRLALPAKGVEAVTKCVFSLEQITSESAEFVWKLAKKLGFLEGQIQIQDHKESFYAYVVSQEAYLWQHQAILFEEEGEGVYCRLLVCSNKTIPRIARASEAFLGKLPEDPKQRDKAFLEMLKKVLKSRIVSAAYLIGEGFEGNWMKESLAMICRGRRAFQGKNLYTKGACYAGALQAHQQEAETVYFCEYKIKEHISLKVSRGDETFFYPIAEAGRNHHEVGKEVRILLKGEPVLELWMQQPGSREARIESLELPGLLVSEEEAARLSILVVPEKEERILLKVQDLGFGVIRRGSGLEWEYEIGRDSHE
ncbi:hypothetical protein D3Z36_02885 [Lachnospiraceae bacterium]|nr:hypothetical protein [Lachnospiraceae bacterium]